MTPTKDIEDINDIKKMVNLFYGKVRKDDLIGPIFNDKIQNHWPEHLTKLYSFWQGILLGERTYTGFPFPPHAQLPISKEHFDRWLSLFTETVDHLFIGEIANEAKNRAYKISDVFQKKLEYIRKNSSL
ncbi:group III truncated hemoglobin [Dysgonomonas capnocytophagoides]|uniref:Group III truncated hemoglobin n=1 Tax=Dysgonomonas capnocytophagoides TaxID=45254 RepID=A0A4Y8LAH2_9BACT|nr:group III truncated hemoglobin [Dysgonomonas capnocytophagoides]TFD97496.1 group III truncated hemoglobin [Dysgonomonas capnocytophagoides]